MCLILLYYCLYWLICASSWYPVNSMLGEQVDLITGINESFIPNWTKSVENEETKNVFDTFVTNNASTQFPFNSMNRDHELLDEVEHIEPKHWPDILYTRTIVSSTTETPLLRNPLYPLIFIQKNSSMQRYFIKKCIKKIS